MDRQIRKNKIETSKGTRDVQTGNYTSCPGLRKRIKEDMNVEGTE